MANAFSAYQRARAGEIGMGQNMLAMEQAAQQMQRQKKLQNILAGAATPAIPAKGPVPTGAPPLPDYRPAGFDVSGAQKQLLAAGFVPEAMQMEAFKPKAGAGFTLGEGQVRYGPSGEVIAEGPKKKEDKSKYQQIVSGLRKEFTNQTKDFVKVRDAFGRIKASAKDPSAAGDLALIFNYMKVLDPGSTVREGEFATAQNAAGVPERVVNVYNQVKSGQRLNPNQRADFVGRASSLYQSQEQGLAQLEQQYSGLATRAGVNPKDVIVDYRVKTKDLSAQDREAIKWANAHPNDPRAIQILKMQGRR